MHYRTASAPGASLDAAIWGEVPGGSFSEMRGAILKNEKTHHYGPAPRAFTSKEARGARGGSIPGYPARVSLARTVTPAASSPPPAATSWRSRARLKNSLRAQPS